MFQSISLCQASLLFRAPGQAGRALLATTCAIALAGVLAMVDVGQAPLTLTGSEVPAGGSLTLQAATPTAVRDAAEALRARILAQPGGVQVELLGLNQTRLSVEYSARRLAAAGISVAELRAALPVDGGASRPGVLVLRGDSALRFQEVADLRVQGARVGDVAAVVRARLDPPVAALGADGRPAVRVVVK